MSSESDTNSEIEFADDDVVIMSDDDNEEENDSDDEGRVLSMLPIGLHLLSMLIIACSLATMEADTHVLAYIKMKPLAISCTSNWEKTNIAE